MSVYSSVRDRELSKFVESPSRGAPNVAIEVTVGNEALPVFSVDRPGEAVLIYDEVNAVAGMSTQTMLSFIVPLEKTFSKISIKVSGQNKAVYSVLFNNETMAKCRTWWGKFDGEINFNLVTLEQLDEIRVEVFNASNSTANFNVTLEGILNES